jgi:hypothetical protein
MNTNDFINRAREIHGNKYDYSLSIYTGSHGKVKIICPIHGLFEQQATCHINRKSQCPKCALEVIKIKTPAKLRGKYKYSLNALIEKFKEIHNNKYDYSLVKNSSLSDKSIIICPIHGEFKQLLGSHLRGFGCIKCSVLSHTKTIEEYSKETEEYIKKAKLKHGNKYDYSKTKYTGVKDKSTIICPIHGEFKQVLYNHLNGQGCSKCGHIKSYTHNKSSTIEFIEKALKVHDEKYKYEKSIYGTNNNTKLVITCPIHGDFLQTPHNHLKGFGCKKCIGIVSKEEDAVADLFHDIKIIRNSRSIIRPYELDIYLPDHKLAIEYSGIYWHSYSYKRSIMYRYRHYDKHDMCKKFGIKLIQIIDNEWNNKKEIIISMLMSYVGKSIKVHARKCDIIKLSDEEFNDFMTNTHIQGNTNTNIKIGLKLNGELMCAMGFNKNKNHEWEISRFSNKLNHSVVGGASKILSHFCSEFKPKTIMSYANRRFSNGNLYEKLGFKLINITKPNYFYVKHSKIFSRQQFQKHKLSKKLKNFDPSLSESQNMFDNGYKKYWDAGHYKYLLTLS